MNAQPLLADVRLLPVIVIDDVTAASPLARCLLEAGVKAIEITLRTDCALAAIERIATEVPDILVGAGSITRPSQFLDIQQAGASFAVSPGATDAVLSAANMPFIPGAATPSECMHLLEHGYRLQKFFPAEQNGGVKTLQAWRGPLSEVQFCPTGGISYELAPSYLKLPNVACIGGSWFVPPAALQAKNYTEISQLTQDALALTLG